MCDIDWDGTQDKGEECIRWDDGMRITDSLVGRKAWEMQQKWLVQKAQKVKEGAAQEMLPGTVIEVSNGMI